jgi:hypothetical protein
VAPAPDDRLATLVRTDRVGSTGRQRPREKQNMIRRPAEDSFTGTRDGGWRRRSSISLLEPAITPGIATSPRFHFRHNRGHCWADGHHLGAIEGLARAQCLTRHAHFVSAPATTDVRVTALSPDAPCTFLWTKCRLGRVAEEKDQWCVANKNDNEDNIGRCSRTIRAVICY